MKDFPRRYDVVLVAVLAVATAVWVVLRPGIARSVIGSPQALLVLAVAGLVGVGLGLAVWRWTRRPLVARGVLLLPLFAVFLWSEVAPQLRGPQVRADADPLAAVATTTAPSAGASAAPSSAAPPTSSPPSSAATTSPATTSPATTSSAAPGPMLLGSGPLTGIDHDASGTVQWISTGTGHLVRFAGFSVEPGPDYVLYVVPKAGATTPDGGTPYGDFDATEGDLNVPVAAPTTGAVTVLVWCRAYAVPVAAATLTL